MREIENDNNAALSKIKWLYSDIESVPFVKRININVTIRNVIGIADAIGVGLFFLRKFPNLCLFK